MKTLRLAPVAVAAIVSLSCGAAHSLGANDSQSAATAAPIGYTQLSCTEIQFYATGVEWADLHYIVNNGQQLNVRMQQSGTNAAYTVSGLSDGAVVQYFFTYVTAGSSAAVDTAWASMTIQCGNPDPNPNPSDACTACMYHNLVWADEFDGSGAPSAANWNYHVGNGYNPGLPGFQGWGNGEWEWYRPEQSYQENGNLVLRADYSSTPTVIAGRSWYQRSARLTTQGKRSWNDARVEARIAMPNNAGTWPAFWMMGDANDGTYTSDYAAPLSYYDTMSSNWASCGEIDIMEHRNAESVTYQNLFWDTRVGLFPWSGDTVANNPGTYSTGDVSQFHTYAMEWNATDMYWYIDNVRVKSQSVSASSQEEYRQKFYVILNLALAGQFPGTDPIQSDFPLFMHVDYVRVYQ